MFQEQGAERAKWCPPPPFRMQKAICCNSDRLASPGRGDGCGEWGSISPQRKMPLKSQGAGRKQRRGCRLQRQGHREGPPPSIGLLPAVNVCCPALGEVSGGGKEAWRCLSALHTHQRCMHVCTHMQTHIHTHTLRGTHRRILILSTPRSY